MRALLGSGAAPQRRYSDKAATRAMDSAAYGAPQDLAAASPEPLGGGTRVYTNWTVYKKQAALSVKFLKPTWGNAGGNGGFTVERPGKVLLEFASSVGERSYDWGSKISVAMSVTELGQIFADPGMEHSFFHDPNAGDPSQKGSTTKSIRWAPAPDGKGYFVSAAVGGSGAAKQSVSVSMSRAEFYVFESLGRYAIPHLLGMDMVFTVQ